MIIRPFAVLIALAIATPARADVGIGVFLGEPTGLDVKIGLARRSALDIVLGWNTLRDGRGGYGHLTYLVQPIVGRGESVIVPVRLGIGVAVFDDYRRSRFGEDFNIGVRFPLEVGFRFRRTPVEIYLQVALKLVLLDDNEDDAFVDLDGGVGIRFYF